MPSGPLRRSGSPLSFPASFGPCAIFLHPVVLAEGGLAHREADLRLPWGALVQAHRDDAGPDAVSDPQVALRVLADRPLVLLVHVDPVVHHLRYVEEAVR